MVYNLLKNNLEIIYEILMVLEGVLFYGRVSKYESVHNKREWSKVSDRLSLKIAQ